MSSSTMESSAELEHQNKMLRQNKGNYKNFKKFDIVEDFSDHYYLKSRFANLHPQGNWTKKIQEEWRILGKDLPHMIFVRVCESRMDLLRAVIVGAEGTPYHDGLFFFDVCFPKSYPRDPPQVHYHSGGLRINPNLYANGKVCLSLLNTWPGGDNEQWTPSLSTMLQVLVSIQGMVLNAKPYYNEPGTRGFADAESKSLQYNERTLLLSLKTMVYTMKKPPKNFENLVIRHFCDRALDILTTCKDYYTMGIGVKCGDGEGKEGSGRFKRDVEGYMNTLVGAFKQIGVEDMEEFEIPTQTPIPTPTPTPTPQPFQKVKKKKTLVQKIRAFFCIKK